MSTVQTKLGRFVWHDYGPTDAEAATTFYTALCGWNVEVWKPGEMDYSMIFVDGEMHGGFWPQSGMPAVWAGHVSVEDADATIEKVTALGGSVLHGPMDLPEVGRFALVQDPSGAAIGVLAYAPDMSTPGGGEGVFLWDELFSPDVEGAKRFYTGVFGWTTSEMDMGEMTYTIFSSGETQVAGLMGTPEGMSGSAGWHPYLAAEDVDASVEKADGLGATTLIPADDLEGIGRSALLLDPNGATFGLFKPVES